MKIKIEKTLVTDDGKEFSVGNDIGFTYFNNETKRSVHIIGRLIDFQMLDAICLAKKSGFIIIDDIEINRCRINGKRVFYFEDMKDIKHVLYQ